MQFTGKQVEIGINTIVEEVLDSARLAGAESEVLDTVRDAVGNNWDELVDAFYSAANREVDAALSTPYLPR